MPRDYAVAETSSGNMRIIASTSGFDLHNVTERTVLSDGTTLLISGKETLEQENAELSRLLQEAQDANAAKELFLSNMSHDIRTPMNAIIGMTALAKKYIDEKARVTDSLNKIEIASAHLLSLINEVLDMSRINSGRMTLEESLFSLSDLLHDTLTIVRPQAEQKHHVFRFSTGEILAEDLYGDTLRLRQIFVNIINNAVKYTSDGGEIQVSFDQQMTEDGRCVLVFRCKDNGIGMTPEFVARIFDPFERASNTTVSRIEGTGLGMSIVKRLIDRMDGTIQIESSPQIGTDIIVRIPMRWEKRAIRTERMQGKHLLVLEADVGIQTLLGSYLPEFGLSYTLTTNASEAIEAITDANFRGERFDGVILGRAGAQVGSIFDTASYIHKANPALPIVLLFEEDFGQIEYRANRAGIEFFIPVPIFRKSLADGLDRALGSVDGNEGTVGAPDLSGKRILLVEDNFINAEIATEILSMTGAQIDNAENGQIAVDKYSQSAAGFYDVILMDVQMPVMDGYAATRAIRALPRPDAAEIPILAMTANTFAEDIARAHEVGMNGHIAKPIDIPKLMQMLRQTI
ncbi:MAG: response regulator [Oscillospiraceae bacterium]|nr:response regulator [Oscillospiraceae bacterium]